TMFYRSQSKIEQDHILKAFTFELSRVKREEIRRNVVDMFANVDMELASKLAENLGLGKPDPQAGFAPDGTPPGEMKDFVSPALSMMNTPFLPDTLKVALFLPDKKAARVKRVMQALKDANAVPKIIGPQVGRLDDGQAIHHSHLSAYPVQFDALVIVEPEEMNPEFRLQAEIWAAETFRHYKPLWVIGKGEGYVKPPMLKEPGVLQGDAGRAADFVQLLARHRFWERNIGVS
ncbi:MAG TPA: catalase-related domain-containing protein, partial [Candidatus Limnocylindria bacterium]|nr:catalase-related domain-containing protein [Candidatus Limnocylindria bacterium]